MKKVVLFLIMLLWIVPVRAAEDLAPNSKSAILIENSTGKIIFEKNSHEKLPMASMTKLMTMLLVMEEIDKGRLKYDDMIEISENASKMGGSQMFLNPGEKIKVTELLKGISIASANDMAVVKVQ